MTDNMRQLLSDLGRLLLEIAGDGAVGKTSTPAAAQEQPPRERAPRKERDLSCVRCGAAFTAKTTLARYCPDCKAEIQRAKLAKFMPADPEGQPPTPAPAAKQMPNGKVRCERMHATISATMCGTRGECQGKPLCPHLPK